ILDHYHGRVIVAPRRLFNNTDIAAAVQFAYNNRRAIDAQRLIKTIICARDRLPLAVIHPQLIASDEDQITPIDTTTPAKAQPSVAVLSIIVIVTVSLLLPSEHEVIVARPATPVAYANTRGVIVKLARLFDDYDLSSTTCLNQIDLNRSSGQPVRE